MQRLLTPGEFVRRTRSKYSPLIRGRPRGLQPGLFLQTEHGDLLRSLVSINSLLSESDMNELLNHLSRQLAEVVGCTSARVYLLDASRAELVLRAFYSSRTAECLKNAGETLRLARLTWHDSALRTTQSVVVQNKSAIEISPLEESLLFQGRTQSTLLVPLATPTTSLGLIVLSEMRSWQRAPFDETKIRIAEALANHAALVLQSMQLKNMLVSRHEQTKLFLNDLSEGVVAVSVDQRVLSMNRAAEKLTGFTEQEVLGARCAELAQCSPTVWGVLAKNQVACSSGGGARRATIRQESGQELVLSQTILPHRDPRGTLVGWIWLIVDVSNEEELANRKAELVAAISHEFRTPLAHITAILRQLQTTDPECPMRVRIFESLDRECMRLSELTEYVPAMLDREKSQAQMELEILDLRPLIQQRIELFQLAHTGHHFEVCAPDQPVFARGDPAALNMILTNLLQNAVKYSEAGSVIRVQVEKQSRNVLIRVVDHGVGLASEQVEKVFDKFYRVPTAAATGISGAGIGLYLTRKLLERQGGQIWVESQPGRGSRFTFTLQGVEGSDAPENPTD